LQFAEPKEFEPVVVINGKFYLNTVRGKTLQVWIGNTKFQPVFGCVVAYGQMLKSKIRF
jgi:hypothetical protein